MTFSGVKLLYTYKICLPCYSETSRPSAADELSQDASAAPDAARRDVSHVSSGENEQFSWKCNVCHEFLRKYCEFDYVPAWLIPDIGQSIYAKLWLNPPQIATEAFSSDLLPDRCPEQHTKNRGKSRRANIIFFGKIQNGRQKHNFVYYSVILNK